MTAEMILALITAAAQAVPQLIDLYNQATSGKQVSKDDVQAILAKYQLDHDMFKADLEAGK